MSIRSICSFIKDETGMETVEYAVMTSLIVAGMLVSLIALGIAVQALFDNTASIVATN